MPYHLRNRGSILILALWTLGVLGMLAMSIGLNIRQRITFLSRLEQRTRIRYVTESAVKKGITVLKNDVDRNRSAYSAAAKEFRHNNENVFGDLSIPAGKTEISYEYWDGINTEPIKMFGARDEESKLNLNIITVPMLKTLLVNIFEDWSDSKAIELAQDIVNWRDNPEDDVHVSSRGVYESVDELLLIKNMTPETYKKLSPFVTVYTDGKININTASKPVLIALGLEEKLVDKILSVRRGKDGMEATADDFIFKETFNIASDLKSFFEMDTDEAASIDQLNWQNAFDVNSKIYTIAAQAKLNHANATGLIVCVYNTAENRVESWSEK